MRGVAPILHEDAAQRPIRRSFAIVEDETKGQIVEGARPGEIRDKIRPDEGRQVFDRPEAPRQDLHVNGGHNSEHRDRERRNRAQEAGRRHAGGRHHHEFAITVEFI